MELSSTVLNEDNVNIDTEESNSSVQKPPHQEDNKLEEISANQSLDHP